MRIDSAWNWMPRKCGPITAWMSPVASSASTRTPSGSVPPVGDPADEGVVEADPLGAAVEPDRRLGALEDDVLVAELEARAAGTASGGPGTPRGTAGPTPAGRRPRAGRTRSWVVALARVARPGADDDQVGAVEGAGRRSPRAAPPATSSRRRRGRGRACSRSRPRRAGSPPSCPARPGSAGSPAWSVSQKRESRWLREPRREQHVLVARERRRCPCRRSRRLRPGRTR